MPTRCNRLVFYCKTYCLLNIFREPSCPSSGALELYRWLLPVVLGPLVYRSLVWCGAVGCASGLRDAARAEPITTGSSHLYNSGAPDGGHDGARNMLSKQ
jgi:hypothetical protein